MLPVIALVGRPNVGKSTLFNYLTRTRDALVADYPGLTRDRQYGRIRRGELNAILVDTGGLTDSKEGVAGFSKLQVHRALAEADIIVFMVDAREGINTADFAISDQLRKMSKSIILVTNKNDGLDATLASSDFYSLALGDPVKIAASHGQGIPELLQTIQAVLPNTVSELENVEQEPKGIAIAVVGRPNVGKSTLVNRILGEERVVVFDQPGTTRDSIYIEFERRGKPFTLIDTAGMRRRAKISEAIEKFSVIKAMKAIDKANVVIYLADASEGVTDQDASLMGMVMEAGRALIIGLNKWDGISPDQKQTIQRQIDLKLPFVKFAEKHPISALHGSGVGKLFDKIDKLYRASMIDLSTSVLSDILHDALQSHQPPLVRGRRIKLKYAHQGGHNPPRVVIHGNQTNALPDSYKRFLQNYFRQRLKLEGTPIHLEFRTSDNPFKGIRNKLTERQVKRRKRLMKHVKKRK
ncbi:MAG: ribosome biogenesis GTPase Der [Methylococcaceae bacterium]